MAEDDEAAFERHSRQSLAIRVLAVVAVVALPLGGYLGYRLAQESRPQPSLAVFDRVLQPDDRSETFRDLGSFAMEGFAVTDSRLLKTIDGVALYGGLGAREHEDGTLESVVCLAVEPTETTGSITCVGRDEFLRVGLRAGAAASGRDKTAVTYRWGPTGDPTRE